MQVGPVAECVQGAQDLSRLSTGQRSLFATRFLGSERIVGNNRPIFFNPLNAKSPDVAQMEETLYYFSAGFLTFKQSDFTSRLIVDRPLLRLQCRVAARVSLMTVSDTWNPVVRCRGANEN